jgi:hypothetical protein
MIPDSPKAKRNASTPMSGGRATGRIANREHNVRSGNSNCVKTKARNNPRIPLRSTDTRDTHTEFHTASMFAAREVSRRDS